MKVLFLTPRRLDEPRSGGTIKSAALLSYLEAKQDVDVACFRDHDERPWERDAGRVVTVPLERRRSVRRLVSSYAERVPLSIERNRSPEMTDRVSELVASGGYDAVFVDGWLMAQYVPDAFAGLRLLHEHNAEHVMWRRHTELETYALRRSLVPWRPAASVGTRPVCCRGSTWCSRCPSAIGMRWPRSPRKGPRSPCSPTSRIRRCSSARS